MGFTIGLADSIAILWMNTLLPSREIAAELIVPITQHFVDLAEPFNLSSGGVNHVKHVARVKRNLSIQLLGLPQGLFRLATLDDLHLQFAGSLLDPLFQAVPRGLQGGIPLLNLSKHLVEAINQGPNLIFG